MFNAYCIEASEMFPNSPVSPNNDLKLLHYARIINYLLCPKYANIIGLLTPINNFFFTNYTCF